MIRINKLYIIIFIIYAYVPLLLAMEDDRFQDLVLDIFDPYQAICNHEGNSYILSIPIEIACQSSKNNCDPMIEGIYPSLPNWNLNVDQFKAFKIFIDQFNQTKNIKESLLRVQGQWLYDPKHFINLVLALHEIGCQKIDGKGKNYYTKCFKKLLIRNSGPHF